MQRSVITSLVQNRTFSSLHHRNFRLLWIGTLISNSGDWMDMVAFNWLVLELTGSPFYLGLVNFCRAVPVLLLTIFGGVAADRVERRKLMMITQAIAMILALLLAAMVSLGIASVWAVMVIATLRGILMSFNLPARQTMLSDLVPRDNLSNAIALNSVTLAITRIIGPSLAGILISLVGVAGCFYINGISFLAVLWTLHAMEIPPWKKSPDGVSVRQSLVEGFEYIRSRSTIMWLVVIALVPMFFGQPYITMLTVFARDVLDIGSVGLGVLTSASAFGAIIGALMLASLKSSAPWGAIMLLGMTAFGLLLIVFSYSTWPAISVLLLIAIGIVSASYNSSNNTLLQLNVPDEFRGRVLSTMFTSRGMVPLGTAMAGILAALFGIEAAVASMGAVIVLLGIVITIVVPSLRKL
ncbi:MAG: MFS transporter [Chloroflexi bacterium]|nr:MFS transporter [Chloroflexota bacterium]